MKLQSGGVSEMRDFVRKMQRLSRIEGGMENCAPSFCVNERMTGFGISSRMGCWLADEVL